MAVTIRAFFALFMVGLVSTSASAHALPVTAIPLCKSIQVAGGDDNGLTGGVIVAHLFVKNVGKRTCSVVGRPWIRIPRLAHPVTVTDISSGQGAGVPSGRVALSPGALASATILLNPGTCSRNRTAVSDLTARAGWGRKSVRLEGSMCNDGSGQISVASFRTA